MSNLNKRVSVLTNLSIFGSLNFGQNLTAFPLPENTNLGDWVMVNGMVYAYLTVGGISTWYPFSTPSRVYIHRQTVAADTWTVQHGLGTDDIWYQIQNADGQIMDVGKTKIDLNSFTVDLALAMTGTVIVVAADSINVPMVTALQATFANGVVVINENGIFVNGSKVVTEATAGTGSGGATAADIADLQAYINSAVAAEAAAREAAIAAIQTLLNSQDLNPALIDELLTRIRSDVGLWTSLTVDKVNVVDIVNTLTSTATDKPLSAAMGKELNDALAVEAAARASEPAARAAAIEAALIAFELDMSTYRSDKDASGVFVTIDRRRIDGTLFKRSVLSGGTSPTYTTRTVTYYAADGATVAATHVYNLGYSGTDLISEVWQS